MRKKIISLLLTVVLVCNLLPGVTFADTEFETADQAVSNINVGWNLGNTFDAYGTWITNNGTSSYETSWGNPVTTQAMIQSVHDQGFNAIRIPITWSQHIDSNNNIDSSWMARVREVVDYAYDLGMYVIINVHHDTGETRPGETVSWIFAENDNFEQQKDKFISVWTQIANEFKDYGDHLLFEGYNEIIDGQNTWGSPGSSDSYEAVASYAQTFVDTVRATGGNNSVRNLIFNTYVGSNEQVVLDNTVVPVDSATNHLILEVHMYTPWSFTGTSQSVTWTSTHNDFNDSDKTEISNYLNSISNWSNQHNIPVIIGEFGAEYKNNDDERAEFAAYFISDAASRGIKCFWWDNGDWNEGSEEGGYAIFNRNSLTWREGIVDALISNSVSENNNPTSEITPEPTETTAVTESTTETSSATSETTIESSLESETDSTSVIETTVSTNEVTDDNNENDKEDKKFNYKPIVITMVVIAVILYAVGMYMLGKKSRNKKK